MIYTSIGKNKLHFCAIFFYLFYMKYLPLHQSICNACYKYFYSNYSDNNYKFEFQKNYACNFYQINEDLLTELFKKYMNNDIWINW